jgi:hypothetical protein
VDEAPRIPKGVTHVALDLWEPGDTTGTTDGPLTCGDGSPSTIHRPYYHYWFEYYHEGRESERRREVPM